MPLEIGLAMPEHGKGETAKRTKGERGKEKGRLW
jgi:hypothetical protein